MTEANHDSLQREVQRLLGRCMLRLQQYEGLLKALLAHHELAGPARELGALQAARIEEFSTENLGGLAKALFESYVVVEGVERPVLDEAVTPTDVAKFGFRVNLELPKEKYTQVKASIKELVHLRNGLVHHLIERFDVWSMEGCMAAAQYLTESYVLIDNRFEELRSWATSVDETRQAFAALLKTNSVQRFLADGIAPDRAIDWPHAGIARVLREAAVALAIDGWTKLDDAVAWIAQHYPEQMPEKYGCRTWPQVLCESRQYDLVYREDESGGKRSWYRPRTERSRAHR